MTKIDPQKMMAQLGKMQEQMAQAQEELKTAFVEHSEELPVGRLAVRFGPPSTLKTRSSPAVAIG